MPHKIFPDLRGRGNLPHMPKDIFGNLRMRKPGCEQEARYVESSRRGEPVKLIIDHEQVQEVTLQMGALEIALTREQAVQMLFGEGYEVVRTGTKPRAESKPRPATKNTKSRPATKGTKPKSPRFTGVSQAILQTLGKVGKTTRKQLLEEFGKEHPELVKKMPKTGLDARLAAFVKDGRVLRSGESGEYQYRVAKDTQP